MGDIGQTQEAARLTVPNGIPPPNFELPVRRDVIMMQNVLLIADVDLESCPTVTTLIL